ncbi:hypothetical protein RUND412_008400 [Rhizina undulata]
MPDSAYDRTYLRGSSQKKRARVISLTQFQSTATANGNLSLSPAKSFKNSRRSKKNSQHSPSDKLRTTPQKNTGGISPANVSAPLSPEIHVCCGAARPSSTRRRISAATRVAAAAVSSEPRAHLIEPDMELLSRIFIDLSEDDPEDAYSPTECMRSSFATATPVAGSNCLPSSVQSHQLNHESEGTAQPRWHAENSSMAMMDPPQWHQPIYHQPEINSYYPPSQAHKFSGQTNFAPNWTNNHGTLLGQAQFDPYNWNDPLDTLAPVQAPLDFQSFAPAPQLVKNQTPNVQNDGFPQWPESCDTVNVADGRPNWLKRSFAAMSDCAEIPVYTTSGWATGLPSYSPVHTQVSSVASMASNGFERNSTHSHSRTPSYQSVSSDPSNGPQISSVKATVNRSMGLRWKAVDTREWSSTTPPPSKILSQAPAVQHAVPSMPNIQSTHPVQTPPQLSPFKGKVRPPIGHKSSCEACNVSFIVTEYSKPALDGEGLLCNFCGSKLLENLKQVGHMVADPAHEGELDQSHSSSSKASASVVECQSASRPAAANNAAGHVGDLAGKALRTSPFLKTTTTTKTFATSKPGTFRHTAMDSDMASVEILPLNPRVRGEGHEEQLEVTFEPLPPLTTKCRLHQDPNCIDERCVDTFFEEYNPFDESLELQALLERTVAGAGQGPGRHSAAPGEIVEDLDESGRKRLQMQHVVVSSAGRSRQRRPYLSIRARGFMRHMGTWKGFEAFDGTIVHIDFTIPEAEILRDWLESDFARNQLEIFCSKLCLKHPSSKVGRRLPEFHIGALVSVTVESIDIQIRQVLDLLPGRTLEDCRLFLNDCKMIFFGALFEWGMVNPVDIGIQQILDPLPGLLSGDSRIPFLNEYKELFTGKGPWISTNTTLQVAAVGKNRNTKLSTMAIRLRRELGVGRTRRESHLEFSNEILNISLNSLFPYKQFKEGSSDIQDICWDSNGERFAIATVTLKDAYNRPGNLMIGSAETLKIKVMDAHKEMRPIAERSAVLDDHIYATVTQVRFSLTGEHLYSGGYDKTVKVWSAYEGELANTIQLPEKCMVMERSSFFDGAIAAGCYDGSIKVIQLNDAQLLSSFTLKSAAPKLYPSTLLWGNEIKPNHIFVGYDNILEKSLIGNLSVFDAATGTLLKNVQPGSQRHFDMAMSPGDDLFITAVSSRSATVKSVIRLYQIVDAGLRFTNVKCESHQHDINKITISPCKQYVTSSATDNTTMVWDVRKTNEVLYCLPQGETLTPPSLEGKQMYEHDSGATWASWGPTNDRFFTGGADGVVKVWDIKSGDPFVKDLCRLDSQVMYAAFSPNFDKLLVGETSGKATLFSSMGVANARPAEFEVDIRDIQKNMAEDAEAAADAAQELLDQGKVKIINGVAWGV